LKQLIVDTTRQGGTDLARSHYQFKKRQKELEKKKKKEEKRQRKLEKKEIPGEEGVDQEAGEEEIPLESTDSEIDD
jgi:hypothetical protein